MQTFLQFLVEEDQSSESQKIDIQSIINKIDNVINKLDQIEIKHADNRYNPFSPDLVSTRMRLINHLRSLKYDIQRDRILPLPLMDSIRDDSETFIHNIENTQSKAELKAEIDDILNILFPNKVNYFKGMGNRDLRLPGM
jgi:hypothetical protein